jgi:hypothetical protein
MFPEYNSNEFLIKYVDEEKDLVTITDQEDLNEALRLIGNCNILRLHLVKKSQNASAQPSNKSAQSSVLNNDSNNDDSKFIEHHAICDACDKRIFGIRYKCGNCEDFDLCSECEAKRLHNPDHLLIKIRRPLPYFAYQRRVLLPNLYDRQPQPHCVNQCVRSAFRRNWRDFRHSNFAENVPVPAASSNLPKGQNTEEHKEEPKKEEMKKDVPKQEEAKKEQPKQQEVKTEEPKQQEVKTEEPKQQEVKKEESKQQEVKKEEPKQQEVKKEEPKQEELKREERRPLSPIEVMLETLENMGFSDRRRNIEVLVRHGCDLTNAVNELLGSMAF